MPSQVWEALYRQNLPRVYRLAYCMARGNAAAASQWAARAFCQAARRHAQDQTGDLPLQWAAECVALARGAAKQDDKPAARPAGLLAALDRLSPQQQVALVAFDFCQMPLAEAAPLAGLSADGFGKALFAARMALRRQMPHAAGA